MSLVGPRPALPAEREQWAPEVAMRLRAKPGLTGLWQVSGRHELAFEDYVRYDLFYVENWSLALDLKIIARTIPALLSRAGAY
jgi:lipopolysaccharide/colanic/teichoic acid biosynthesis glycosyltransferase